MAKKIREFVQPKRRSTRQRSGFSVSGTKTGSEAKIENSYHINGEDIITFTFRDENVEFITQFQESIRIYGFGGYVFCETDIDLSLKLEIYDSHRKLISKRSKSKELVKNIWLKFGLDIFDQDELLINGERYSVEGEITFKAISLSNRELNFNLFGLSFGDIQYYQNKQAYLNPYNQKTYLYIPEIYYLNFKSLGDFVITSRNKYIVQKGIPIALKSCNRCARFLPIDLSNERNALGFSNHCKLRAPCKHNAFSKYKVESGSDITTEFNIVKENSLYYLKSYYGFQLECRTCKKFEVNAPLNPLRDRAQHHEDGARRRAFERLLIELGGNDPIKNFRTKYKIEFPEYLLEKFNYKCFGCNKDIDVSSMDIDHTLPLLYLWPLDETATALCKTCNSQKHDMFPKQFSRYTSQKLIDLSEITGISYEILNSDKPLVNPYMKMLIIEKVVWLFDDFLSRKEYQKIKKGKLKADLIYKALDKVLSQEGISLVDEYRKISGKYPKSVTLSR